MTSVTFNLDDAIRRLHGDLSFCLRVHSLDLARERLAVALEPIMEPEAEEAKDQPGPA